MPEWAPDTLLGMLPEAARGRLLSLGKPARYPAPGRVLIREHEETSFVIIILSGVVRVTGSVANGPEILLAIRTAGDAVGEFAAVDQQPRSATATSCGPLEARIIDESAFNECLKNDPDISQAINKTIVAKMRLASQHRIDFSVNDVPVRVARVLLHLALSYGKPSHAKPHPPGDASNTPISVPLTQSELASLSVASSPTVERVLRPLRNDGVLATGYRAITILDIHRLREAAHLTPDS